MKISNKEKNLLIILLIAVFGYLFYTFLFVPQTEKLKTIKQEEQLKADEYSRLQTLIQSEGKIDLDIEAMKTELLPVARTYFGDIDQEETIVLLDEFGQKVDLNLNGILFIEPSKTSITEIIAKNLEEKAKNNPPEVNAPAPQTEEKKDETTATPEPATAPEVVAKANAEVDDNFIILPAQVEFKGDYKKLMDYMIEVGSYYKRISSYSIEVKLPDNSNKELEGKINFDFLCIDNVEKYIPKESSALEYDLIPKSTKADPFEKYSWAYVITNTVNNQGMGLGVSQPGVLSIQPGVSPAEQGLKVTPGQPNTTKEDPLSMGKTVELGSANQIPMAHNIFYDKVLYNFDDPLLRTFTDTEGNGIVGSFNSFGDNQNMFEISYNFASGVKESEVFLDVNGKDLFLEKKPRYVSMKVHANEKLNHMIGLVLTDARGMDYRVYMADYVDWTGLKEIKGVLPDGLTYPARIKSIFVLDKTNDNREVKLAFDDLIAAYVKN